MDERQLLKLKGQIDEAEREASQLEGQRKLYMQQLKEQHGCATVEEAEEKMESLERDITKKDKELAALLTEIEERYNG
jgi:flagellar biosynthesis chaperone FliJ